MPRFRGVGARRASRRSDTLELLLRESTLPRRIVSLLPSATEMVCALGARAELVGISHECDFPAGLEGLDVLTRPRLSGAGASRAIDAELRDLLRGALSPYQIDLRGLEAARPDVIVTQDLCSVCAVSLESVERAAAELLRHPVEIVSLHPRRLDDVWGDVARVGSALGREAAGVQVARELRSRVARIAARSAGVGARPSLLAIEWLEPTMIAGLWMPELIELAGGTPLVTRAGEHAPTLSRDALAGLEPDVVLIKPCGFSLARTLEDLATLRRALPWEAWRRRALRVAVADGNAYFNRPGPRLVESLEIVAALLHPAEFPDLAAAHRASVAWLDRELEPHPGFEGFVGPSPI
jgi:iron complex transport system substrate-binding protein